MKRVLTVREMRRAVRWDASPEDRVEPRPRTRGECAGGSRPCPWAGCRHHLGLDVSASGSLTFTRGLAADPAQMVPSCSLDVADEGAHSLEEIGDILNLSRERVRQIIDRALARRRLRGLG